MTTLSLTQLDLTGLQSQLTGRALTPADPDYEPARHGWNRSADHHPALIVQAQTVADVVAAVRFARRHSLPLAVLGTGHGTILPADGALLLLTAALQDLHIDPAARTARLGAGLQWGQVLEEAQKHGLAPLLGSSPTVGVVGFTLGGGYGWLGRKYGLALDSVLEFELVDPSGQERRASATENPELFWALRGGGGGFGVITALTLRLFPVTEVYAGNLFYPIEMAEAVLRRYADWALAAPNELTSSVVLMNFPPLPVVPEPLRGRSFVILRGCYCGPLAAGKALIDAWRVWSPPVMDAFQAIPFSQAATISNDPHDPSPAKSSGAWMRALTPAAIQTLIRFAQPPTLAMLEVRHAGGAVAQVDPQATAFGHRSEPLLLSLVAFTPTPESYTAAEAHMTALLDALGPALSGTAYMNFMDGQEAHRRTAQGFPPEKLARLQALKADLDPDNLLRFGFALGAR